jgi:hypothetical protein
MLGNLDMRKISQSLGVVFAFFAMALAAEGKTFPDLSAFRGKLKGTMSLSVGAATATGPSSVNVIVPKSGRSATFNISGSVSASGTTYPLSNTFTFHPSKNFTVQDLVFHFLGGSTTSASGKYSSTKRNINYSAPFNYQTSTGTVSGTIRVHTTKTKQTVELTYTIFVDGSGPVYQFNITASRKIK